MDKNHWLAKRFDENRGRLRGVAYRMLGSASEADDAVQEAWLKLSRSDTDEVERGFHVIVNSRCVSGADDTDMGSSVHDDIGDGRIPAMPCSDSRPTRSVSVAGFVAGGAGGVIKQIAAKACCARLQKRYGGRHTARTRRWLPDIRRREADNCNWIGFRLVRRPFRRRSRIVRGHAELSG